METLMSWSRLLTARRMSGREPKDPRHRSAFQRDYDRIIFSPSFRRLADKTQVFPMPTDDHVHSRLTHSLEAASIGRSLGVLVGADLQERGVLEELSPQDVGDAVAAACLAHDLGNPPFGHVGEDAIREFFRRHQDHGWFTDLPDDTRLDLLRFEGNAQAFALVTRIERASEAHGLDLTLLTLGALCKYPCASRDAHLRKSVDGETSAEKHGEKRVHRKKHGCFLQDHGTMLDLATRLGLVPEPDSKTAWCRHPLAFITEIADDIAYQVLDLEDALRLRLVPAEKYQEHMHAICGDAVSDSRPLRDLGRTEMLRLAARYRAVAIHKLIEDAATQFARNAESMVEGCLAHSLREDMSLGAALDEIEATNRKYGYQARDVLKLEIAGSAAIQGVLEALISAAVDEQDIRSKSLRALLKDTFEAPSIEARILQTVAHVSGMTDNYILRLYRELTGIRLPGDRM